MKTFFKLLMISVTLAIVAVSCSKDEDTSISSESSVIKQTATERIQKLKSLGYYGGSTSFYEDGSLVGKSSISNFFISQSPLVEFKFEIDIEFDSITEYKIDSVTRDTISINTYLTEISRDTVALETGPGWFPLDYQNFTSVVLGLPEDINDTTKLFVKVENLDSPPVEQNGLLFTGFGREGTQHVAGYKDGADTDLIYVDDNFLEVTDEFFVTYEDVPIYDDRGFVSSTSPGIRFNGFFLRNFLIENSTVERKLKITFKLSDGREVSNTFDLKFVQEDTYLSRQCWLEGSLDCEDFF